MVSLTSLLCSAIIVLVVAGDNLEEGNKVEQPDRGKRSIISAIVDGLKNIHANLHKKEVIAKDDAPEERDGRICSVEYVVVESVHYSEVMVRECRTHNVTTCTRQPVEECQDQVREECHQVTREQCKDKLEEECDTKYRTEHSQEDVRECDQKCQYRWEGTGGDKRWVVDTSTCICEDITRDTVSRVPYLDCSLVSRRECKDVPVKKCQEVKDTICRKVEREECEKVPHRECNDIHKKVPNTITRKKPVQVCEEEGGVGVIAA